MLAVLLLEANAPVPAGKIVDAVWGERPPENGVNVVQKYVAGLRRGSSSPTARRGRPAGC